MTHPPVAQGTRRPSRRASLVGWWWVLPALAVYGTFVLYPLSQTVRYSFYDWDGIGVARFVGLDNYRAVFEDERLRDSVLHSLVLIVFFTVLPVLLGLVMAALVADLRLRRLQALARVVLFLPQVIPLAGAAIAWSWLYSSDGAINEAMRAVGLGSVARPWLADFGTALPAVGLIGTWLATGLCTVLFTVGIQRLDPALHEAAALDGAGRVRRLVSVTVPSLRREIAVVATVLTIAALASFDVVYVATAGGPGYATTVPGVLIFRLVFTEQAVGAASALAVVLVVLVLVVITPLQWIGRQS